MLPVGVFAEELTETEEIIASPEEFSVFEEEDTEPTEESFILMEETTISEEKTTEVTEETTTSAEEATEETEETTAPAEKPIEGTVETTAPADEPTEETVETTAPVEEPTKETEEPTIPVDEPTEGMEDTTAPVEGSIEEVGESSLGMARYANARIFYSIEDAAAYLREQMKMHSDTVILYFYEESIDTKLVSKIFNAAVAHTGNPTEGDYLSEQIQFLGGSVGRYPDGAYEYNAAITYHFTYYTSAAQETEMDAAVAALLAQLDLGKVSDYEKVKGIYDWICSNVTYDYEHGEDYKLQYTAYAALVNKSAVCAGYALLFYRLALELGIDTRYIAGIGNSERHAWNIVKLGSLYYNVDSMADASLLEAGQEYKCFLKNDQNFPMHTRDEKYLTDEFYTSYPMDVNDYEPSVTVLGSGECGTDLAWTVNSNGLLTITGSGEMQSYSSADEVPWNQYAPNIVKLVVDKGVTSLGDYAVAGCTQLCDVILPEGIQRIGQYAFYECSGLKQLTIPTTANVLDTSAFSKCYGLTTLELPVNVTVLGAEVFSNCTSLSKITFYGPAPKIGSNALYNVTATVYYPKLNNWPDSVIANYGGHITWSPVLAGYKGEITWNLTDGLLTISGEGDMPNYLGNDSMFNPGNGAPWWEYRTQIREVVITEGITSIGGHAFRGYSNITAVTIPDSVIKIDFNAFSGCSKLTEITLPKSLKTLADGVFLGSGLETIVIPGTVSTIPEDAFSGCNRLTSVVFENGITEIGEYAFQNCTSLTEISFSSSIRSIQYKSFSGCTSLEEFYIPATLTDVAEGSFINCTSLRKFSVDEDHKKYRAIDGVLYTNKQLHTWPAGKPGPAVFASDVTSIGKYAFSNTTITEINIPSSVTSLGYAVFQRCTALTHVVLPNGITAIPDTAFYNCTALTSISIPVGIKIIDDCAFRGCSSLTSIVLPEGVTSIGELAFNDCSSLTSINIPEGVTSIGSSAFFECSSLTSINIPEGVTKIEYWTFYHCSSLTSITLPEGVTCIGKGAFIGCSSLTSINIPEGVTSIGDNAFRDCYNLSEISIPQTVESIGDYAFNSCQNLVKITFNGDAPQIGHSAFGDVSAKVYYPGNNDTWTTETKQKYDYGADLNWTCAICESNGHTEVVISGRDSTCAEAGLTDGKMCSVCGTITVQQEPTPLKAHTMNDWTTAEQVTCTTQGKEVRNCSHCTYTETRILLAGHRTGPWTRVTLATCVTDGAEKRECSRCDWFEVKTIPATGKHTQLTRIENRVEPTCQENGSYDEVTYCYYCDIELQRETHILTNGSHQFEDYVCQTCGFIGGNCGTNLTWSFDPSSGTLTLEGHGNMKISIQDGAPWLNYRDQIVTVELPQGLTSIGTEAFYECTNLSTINIPDSVTELGYGAFAYSGIQEIIIPEGVTVLPEYVFFCSNIENVTLPFTLTQIGESAFNSCYDLTELVIPDGVVSLGYCAFSYSGIREIVIPEGITVLPDNAFSGSSIEKVTLPSTLTSIGTYAFSDCTNLSTINIPDSVIEFGCGAFAHSGIQEIVIPEGTTIIPEEMFRNSSVQKITLPSTLVSIDFEAFYGCLMTSLRIPASVKQIADDCFVSCHSLAEIWFSGNAPAMELNVFPSQLVDIYYPANNSTWTTLIKENVHNINWVAYCVNDHVWQAATCTEPKICTKCGQTQDFALGHNYQSKVITPTCTTGGYTTYNCIRCSESYTADKIDAAGHKPNISAPTELEAQICTVCGTVLAEKLAHTCVKITKQPKNSTSQVGTKATFSVTLENVTEDMTYQWQVSTNNGDSWKNYSGSGNKTAKISVTVTEGHIGYMYRCRITDSVCGNKVTSKTGQIRTPVTITEQPVDAAAKQDETVSTKVTAVGKDLTYKWYYKNAGGSKFAYTSSFTGNTYSVKMNEERNGRQVYCVITDAYGNTVTSNTVTLKMKASVSITKQPTDQYTSFGSKAITSVTASGTGLTYAWYYRNAGSTEFVKSSVTSATYAVNMNKTTKDRDVYCIVTDSEGNSVQSDTIHLYATASITKQPADVLVANGEQAKSTVTAVGDGLSYQWYIKNVGATSFSKSSVTSSTYNTKMSKSVHGRQAYCVITDKYGYSVQTETVSIRAKVFVVSQPKSVAVKEGNKAVVSVSAVGEGLTYQWYYAKQGATKFTLTTSFKGSSYSVEMNTSRAGRHVYCVITDKYGNSVQTNTVSLNMAVMITGQPKDVRVDNRKVAETSVTASGDRLTYQWYYKNAGSEKFSKSSTTSNTYSMTMSSNVHGRQVYCVIKDQYGNSVQTETVTLSANVFISIQPKNRMAAEGATAKTTVEAVGNGLTYQWYYKNYGAKNFSKSSTKTATYSTKMSDTTNGRQVYCVVTDAYGNSVQSKTVTLHMPVKIYKQPQDSYTAIGDKVSIKVEARGSSLKYQWYMKNTDSDTFVKSSVTGSTYVPSMTAYASGRQVYCIITDSMGNTAQTETVTLHATAKITKQPTDVRVNNGKSVKTTVTATGDGLKYQWYTKNVGSSGFSKSSITKATYTTAMSKSVHGRQVYCIITDAYGNSVQTDTVTLRANVFIQTQPKSVTVAEGKTAKVSVSAYGEGLTYQWYFANKGSDQFKVTDAFKSNSYSVDMNNSRNGRRIYCVITDKYGNSVQTETVTIGMNYQLKISKQPVSVTVAEGEKAKVTVSVMGEGLTYQWYFANKGSDNFKVTDAFKGNSYSVEMNKTRNGRRIYCVITDQYGNQVTTDVVTISMK